MNNIISSSVSVMAENVQLPPNVIGDNRNQSDGEAAGNIFADILYLLMEQHYSRQSDFFFLKLNINS